MLAVHMDNGWDTPISSERLSTSEPPGNLIKLSPRLEWQAVQRAFIEAGVPDIELPTDIAIMAVLVAQRPSMEFVPFSVVETRQRGNSPL